MSTDESRLDIRRSYIFFNEFKITKERLRKIFKHKSGKTPIYCSVCFEDHINMSFKLRKDGSLRIGCTRFTPREVAKARAWSRA
jgi:hypothetical protein